MTLALRCALRASAFSGERLYAIALASGEPWQSLVPISHCWHLDWSPIASDEPQDTIDALVEVMFVRFGTIGTVSSRLILVDVPNHTDSAYVWVQPDAIVQRPQAVGELIAARPGAR